MNYIFKKILLFIFIIPLSVTSQVFMWDGAKSYGSNGSSPTYGICTDIDDNVYVYGTFRDTLSIGDTSFICNQEHQWSSDGYIAKFNSNGDFLLALHLITRGNGKLQQIKCGVDSEMNIIVSGIFTYNIRLQDTTLTSLYSTDSFIAKFNKYGIRLWVNQIKGTGSDDLYLMDISAENNIVFAVCHDTYGQFNFNYVSYGDDTVLYRQDNYLVLALYNSKGELRWLKSGYGLLEPVTLWLWNLKLKEGHVYLCGFTCDTLIFDNDTIPVQWGVFEDANMMAKYDERGNKVFLGNFAHYRINNFSIDDEDNYFTIGHVFPPLIIGNDTINEVGPADICFAKYDSNLDLQWYHVILTNQGYAGIATIIYDTEDRVYLLGHYKDEMQLGDTSIFAGYYHRTKFFIARYNSNGDFIHVISSNGKHHHNGTNEFTGTKMIIDNYGDLLVTGNFNEEAFFGSDTLTSLVGFNQFYAKLLTNPIIVEINPEIPTVQPDFSYIKISPNPTLSRVNIELREFHGNVIIQLFNSSGENLFTKSYNPHINKSIHINLQNYPNGIYLLKINSNNYSKTKKIIKL
ncbi:MAG: T9SS type A sorting domain-containing protein [Bacteroidales bacterium]|nr:T9SS type A sorting domain-containing protein [Bacteroidales bacterium]